MDQQPAIHRGYHAATMSLEATGTVSHRRVIWAAVIILLTLLAYLPAMHAGYIWDDDSYVIENEHLRDIEGLGRIWIPRETPQYYPMVFTTFWIEYQIWGLDPMGYHLVNIVLHALNAVLLWLVLMRLGVPGSWLIAAVFALHPIQVESVAWITERKNVLSLFFYLIAALAYLRFDQLRFGWPAESPAGQQPPAHEQRHTWGWYGLALLAFILALLSKSVTCSLPAALILVMLWLRAPISVKRLVPLAPMFIVGFILAMNTAVIERAHVGAVGPDWDFSLLERVLIASKSLLFYPWKTIWPHPLIFIYPRWEIDATDITQYWALLVCIAIGTTCLVAFLRGWRGPFVALSFYAGTVFPAIGFFNVYPHLFSFVADHFYYHASIGVITFLIGSIAYFVRRELVLRMLASLLLPVLFTLTWLQSTEYEDAKTLYRTTVEKNPDAWMPHNNLSSILLRQAEAAMMAGRHQRAAELIEEALYHTDEALRVRPKHHTALANRAEALRLLGRYEDALASLKIAIEQVPHWADYHWQRGRLLTRLEREEQAIDAFADAVERAPRSAAYRMDLARRLVAMDRLDDAADEFETVLEHHPEHAEALLMLGGLRARQGRDQDALGLYWRAVDAAQTLDEQLRVIPRLIRLLAHSDDPAVRDLAEARRLAEQLVNVTEGRDPASLGVLGSVLAAAGETDEAEQVLRMAISMAREMQIEPLVDQLEQQLNEITDRDAP